jgi:hypothetical protein
MCKYYKYTNVYRYTILGLEQTDNSQDLGNVSALPSKCVLLLGKQKRNIFMYFYVCIHPCIFVGLIFCEYIYVYIHLYVRKVIHGVLIYL